MSNEDKIKKIKMIIEKEKHNMGFRTYVINVDKILDIINYKWLTMNELSKQGGTNEKRKNITKTIWCHI